MDEDLVKCFECEQLMPLADAKPCYHEGYYQHKTNCICHQCNGVFDFASAHLSEAVPDDFGDIYPIHLQPGVGYSPEFNERFGPELCRPCELANTEARKDCIPGVTVHRPYSWYDGPHTGLCRVHGVALPFDTAYDQWGLRILEAYVMDGDRRIPIFKFTLQDDTTRWYPNNPAEPIRPGYRYARSAWQIQRDKRHEV